jgi:Putative DNA-binding domain
MQTWQSDFASALLNSEAIPKGVISHNSNRPDERFAIYRNNVMVGLVNALEARFPATRKIVGDDFFKGAARRFAAAHPPRSPVMMFYGEGFPEFLASFEPAGEIPYLADIALLEAARTRTYHAADAEPLTAAVLAATAPDSLARTRFTLHPSLEIVASPYPIVTIWAMNSGEVDLAPITDWRGEDALIVRPWREVEVRRLPAGGRIFLQSIAEGKPLKEAAKAALDADARFDLPANLAALFSGLAVAMTSERPADRLLWQRSGDSAPD